MNNIFFFRKIINNFVCTIINDGVKYSHIHSQLFQYKDNSRVGIVKIMLEILIS